MSRQTSQITFCLRGCPQDEQLSPGRLNWGGAVTHSRRDRVSKRAEVKKLLQMQRTASHFAGLEYGLRGLERREPSRKMRPERESGARSQKALCTILKSFVCVEQNDGGALKDFSRKVTGLSFQFEKITHYWVGMETADQTRRLLGQNSPLRLICECLSFCMLENLAYQCGDIQRV